MVEMIVPDWSGDVLQVDPSGIWPQLADYQRACDAAMSDLTLANRLQPFSEDVPTVVCVMRNEQRRLPGFLQHYDGLGAERIHIVDNGSTDKTAEIALAHPKVTLWRTGASYAGANFGQLWTGGLARQHGLGKWVLNVEADDLLEDDFPQRVKAVLADNQHWNDSLEYRKYDDWISERAASSLYSRIHSARYASSHSLVAQGIVQNIIWI